jgi:hypothetical protein
MLRTTMWHLCGHCSCCRRIIISAASTMPASLCVCYKYILYLCLYFRAAGPAPAHRDLQGHVVYASNFYRLDHLTRGINFTGDWTLAS